MGRYSNYPELPIFGQTASRKRTKRFPRVHSATKGLGPQLVAQLITDYRAGVPTTQLTGIYGIGKDTVLRILESNGVPRRNQPLSPELAAKAIELYTKGWSLAKVGNKFGREHTVIRDVLVKAGIPRRDSHGQSLR